MIHKDFLRNLTFTFMVSSLQSGLHVFCGTWLRCSSLEWRPRASAEGPREAGIGQRRGCRDRAYDTLGHPHPATGSHLPAEDTAPPFAGAPFRVVAPCPAPQKPHTPLCPTAGFRIIHELDRQ